MDLSQCRVRIGLYTLSTGRLIEVASTQIGCEVPHQKMYEASTPLIEVQARTASLFDIDASDVQVLKLWKLIASAYRALRAIFTGWV